MGVKVYFSIWGYIPENLEAFGEKLERFQQDWKVIGETITDVEMQGSGRLLQGLAKRIFAAYIRYSSHLKKGTFI